ncbi:MAG: hypothetical protein IPH18_07475 [Chitinophagaceae bacterium]|nr:hypothetical protein [Chitinophagaceae bacterium]
MVEDTIWGDYSPKQKRKRVRVKIPLAQFRQIPEMYDVSDAEPEDMKKEGGKFIYKGLAAFASTALNLDITIPIEILGEKPKGRRNWTGWK